MLLWNGVFAGTGGVCYFRVFSGFLEFRVSGLGLKV